MLSFTIYILLLRYFHFLSYYFFISLLTFPYLSTEISNYRYGYTYTSSADESQFIGPNASYRSLKVAVLFDIIPECVAMIALVWLAKPKKASSTITVSSTSKKINNETSVVSSDDRDPVSRISTTKNILQSERVTPKVFDRTFSSDDEEDPYNTTKRPIEKGLLSDQHMMNSHMHTGNSNENL